MKDRAGKTDPARRARVPFSCRVKPQKRSGSKLSAMPVPGLGSSRIRMHQWGSQADSSRRGTESGGIGAVCSTPTSPRDPTPACRKVPRPSPRARETGRSPDAMAGAVGRPGSDRRNVGRDLLLSAGGCTTGSRRTRRSGAHRRHTCGRETTRERRSSARRRRRSVEAVGNTGPSSVAAAGTQRTTGRDRAPGTPTACGRKSAGPGHAGIGAHARSQQFRASRSAHGDLETC